MIARASISRRAELGEQDYRLAEESRVARRATARLKRASTQLHLLALNQAKPRAADSDISTCNACSGNIAFSQRLKGTNGRGY